MKRILGNTSTAFMIIAAVLLENSYYSQSTLKGHVTEQNSGKKPVAGVMVKSLGANSVVSSNSGEFVLTFQDRLPGMNAVLRVEKEGWEVVNEKELSTLIPATPDESRFKIIVCKVGTLEKSKKEYYTITDKYIQQEYQRKINALNREKEGWQQEAARLGEQYESLQKQLEKMADEYSRINLDDATDIERQAIEFFETGKIDESIQLRESLKSDEEIKNAIAERKKAEEEIKIRKEKIAIADSAVTVHTRNMKVLANNYILRFDYINAEKTLERLALADTTNFDNLFDFAVYLGYQNKSDKAIVYYHKSLWHAKTEENIMMVQNELGNLYREHNEYISALLTYQKALGISEHLAKVNPERFDPDVAAIQNNLGNLYHEQNDYVTALSAYQKALGIYERLEKVNAERYDHDVATIQNNLGNLYREQNEYVSALLTYQKAFGIYERLAKVNPERYDPYVAMTQNNLGILYRKENDYASAIESCQKALEIRERLAKVNPERYAPDVAKTHNNLGVLYQEKNDYTSALLAYQKALGIYERFAKVNPERYDPDVASTQNNLGSLYRKQNDYATALLAFQKALEIYECLAKVNPERYDPDVADQQNNLGVLYSDQNDNASALVFYQKALRIYERFAKVNPKRYEPYVAMTQNNLGILYLKQNDYGSAIEACQKALEIYERLAKENSGAFELKVCKTIVLTGSIQEKDYQPQRQPQIDADLARAKTILTKYPGVPLAEMLSGFVNELEEYFKEAKKK